MSLPIRASRGWAMVDPSCVQEPLSNRSLDGGRWRGDPDLVAVGAGRSIATKTLQRFDLSPG